MSTIYIVDGARTAFTSFGGSFVNKNTTELGTETAKEAMKRSKVDPEQIDHVIYGNVIHTHTNAAYLARHIGLHSGIPIATPAMMLNRLCGSGLQAIISGAQDILLNDSELVLAGGAENMSQSPYSNFEKRFGGSKMGDLKFVDMLSASLHDNYTGQGTGMTAEHLAEQYNISREEQDEYAVLSHQRAQKATMNGIFKEEIVPVAVKQRRNTFTVDTDEYIKADSSAEKLG